MLVHSYFIMEKFPWFLVVRQRDHSFVGSPNLEPPCSISIESIVYYIYHDYHHNNSWHTFSRVFTTQINLFL